MRYYELTLRANTPTGLNINTLWYRQASDTPLVNADLQALHDWWVANHRGTWMAIHTSNYTLQEITVQGYDNTWNRAPFLPLIQPHSVAGGDASAAAPPFVAVIASMKVEPVLPGPRMKPNGTRYFSPVRRGNLAISPVSELSVNPDGTFVEWNITTGAWSTLRANLLASFTPTGQTLALEPIRVSSPLKDEVLRGYGVVRAVAFRQFASTRRSRMMGRGA